MNPHPEKEEHLEPNLHFLASHLVFGNPKVDVLLYSSTIDIYIYIYLMILFDFYIS